MAIGNVTVNPKQTFTTMLLLSVSQKMKFGSDTEPEITKQGERKWVVKVAVEYLAENGMPAASDVLNVGLTGGDMPSITPGTPVEFDSLREGVSDPQMKQNGKGISGGQRFWMGSGLRSAVPASSFRSSKTSEPAA